jgi:hypothetical protein
MTNFRGPMQAQESMRGPVRRVVLYIISILAYLHRTLWIPVVNVLVETGIGLVEEAILTVVRELSSVFIRVVNGVSGMFVSLFIDRAHWKRHKSAWSDGEVSEHRATEDAVVSTLNAIVEREVSESNCELPSLSPVCVCCVP